MSNEDRLADLLVAWEDAAARGETPTPEEHCRDHPDLTTEFRRVLHQLVPVNAVMQEHADPLEHLVNGRDLGRYRPLRFHARGGLGAVFVAEDAELRRTVALKCLQPLAAIDPDARRRFLAEAEITTRLEHPGVVPMYGLVEDARGTPYYAMRFVRGATLADEIKRLHESPGEVEFRRLLQSFVAVCKTVAYAHSRGVVHRDLKPDNIMIGPYGEALLLDWGLAKSGDRGQEAGDSKQESEPHKRLDTHTQLGTAKGTPAYMSPEQARGEWDRVGPASDVFGLGAVLFVLLTGKRPHDGRDVAEIIEKAKAGLVAPARTLNPTVPRPLDAVCQKATAARNEDRYSGALELAQDVERWLAGEPVSAWREPLTLRARRWAKRHRTLVTTASAVLLVGSVVIAVAGARLDRANRELEMRNLELAAALKSEQEARALAEDRKEKMRVLLRDSVAFTLWGAAALGMEPGAMRAQLTFFAAQYEAALRESEGRVAEDLVFLRLTRLSRAAPLGKGAGRRDHRAAIAEMTAQAAADPSNEWVALWLGVSRALLGIDLLESGDPAEGRRELLAGRELLARSAARGRVEAPLLLGDVTLELCRMAEALKDVSRADQLKWVDDALAGLGSGPPAGVLQDALADNWAQARAHLAFNRVWLQFDGGKAPGSGAAFRSLAAEVAAARGTRTSANAVTQLALVEARSRRVVATCSTDPDGGVTDLEAAAELLAGRVPHGANDAVFRDELARAQVGFLFYAVQRTTTASEKEPLKVSRVAELARKSIAILSDDTRTRDREPYFRNLFPKHTEAVLRTEWEAVLKKTGP